MKAVLRIIAAGVIGGALAPIITAGIVYLIWPSVVFVVEALASAYGAMMVAGFKTMGWWFGIVQLGVFIGISYAWDRMTFERRNPPRDDVGLGG